jgi:hypothetical protein
MHYYSLRKFKLILDIHGTIYIKSQSPNIEVLRKRISEGLSKHKAKVSINQYGAIQWQGSWSNLNPFRFRLWGSEGKISCTEDVQGGVKITYYVSLIVARILCTMFSLSTILLNLLGEIELLPLFMFNLVIWLWIYGGNYLIHKLWHKGFMKKLIHHKVS